MSKIDAQTLEKYQKLLEKDPTSKVFAALADAYREMQLLDQAEALIKKGLTHHPKYAAAYVVWARIYKDKGQLDRALELLHKAIMIAPDNFLAQQILGDIYLYRKDTKQALKAYKMVLFLNPNNTRAQQVIQKLESLSASDYEPDTFQMRPIKESISQAGQPAPIERTLSLIDAMIVRNQIDVAHKTAAAALKQYPDHPLLLQRLELLNPEFEALQIETADEIKPQSWREKVALQNKIERLEKILRTVEKIKNKELSL
jgi:tetratricopeptide (TPR) repeat protein